MRERADVQSDIDFKRGKKFRAERERERESEEEGKIKDRKLD